MPHYIGLVFGRLCTLLTHQITLLYVCFYNFLTGEHGCLIYFNRIIRHHKRQLRAGPFSGSQLTLDGLGDSHQHVNNAEIVGRSKIVPELESTTDLTHTEEVDVTHTDEDSAC
jgi:hypothetical protein